MITMSTLGSNGRTGNQLFQYAAMIGVAKKYGVKLVLPPWPYAKYFKGTFPEGPLPPARLLQEPTFNYNPNLPIKEHEDVDLKGYFQSEYYWKDAKEEVKQALAFTIEFKKQVLDRFVSRCGGVNPMEKQTLAISVRRGDYVGNPHYAQLGINYYILAMFERFPDWRERSIIVFSDDIPWCRVHFSCLPNVYFSENNNEIEDLCLMSQCKSFIISNSTFSWWGAYLSELIHGPIKVVRPNHHFDGGLKEKNDTRDLYPTRWEVFDHLNEWGHTKKINLKNTCFTIPVTYDHEDRNVNLGICLTQLRKYFDTEIRVMEQMPEAGPTKFSCLQKHPDVLYEPFVSPVFHRTRMLNKMAKATSKQVIFNWDADVVIAPLQIWLTASRLTSNLDMCFPYDGRFARIPRNPWVEKLTNYEDIGIVGDIQFSGMEPTAAVSVGGAVAFNREAFLAGGGENEIFISYGSEDVERDERFRRLGYRQGRVPGAMYHINHWVGINSSTSNPHYGSGKAELGKIRDMTDAELKAYVEGVMRPRLGGIE